MLQHLDIKNYLLIHNLSLDFYNGFTVITGETGSGKSILLGAIQLLLGERADSGALLDKSKKCVIEGVFDIKQLDLKHFFEQNDLEYEDTLIIRREISPNGRSRAFINDTPVNLSILKSIGEQLINIHSQFDTLLLGTKKFQYTLLDSFANTNDLFTKYLKLYENFTFFKKEIEEDREMMRQLMHENDYKQFQWEELKNADIKENEYEELHQQYELLSHAELTLQTIKETTALLYENEQNIYQNIAQIIQKLRNISSYLPKAEKFIDILENIEIEIKDISMSLSELADSLDYSPDELQRIENRLDLFQKLMFKHHVQTTEELLELQENLKKDIKNIDELANKIVKKEANLLQIETELRDTAIKLYNERKKAIPELEKLIIKLISRLGMQDGKFIIQLEKLDEPTIFGFDKLELKFSANKGIEPEALERVASGGEMSRLMLALKSIIASQNYLPTLIFDEIDMGVSGNIAAQMADLLSDMSMHHQVIVITHLPQIAAKANYHIQVEKKSDRDITHSEFKYLTDDERIISIASMLSNDNILDTAIDTARQLLKQV
ncbi:MAG: DNA repair protein RecN [Bacteroidales bacterium]|jgi:DNA repair protein RecN (Recombination protein N)|nr:DNA repair protein RecN [Bacteroidales bacterium]MDD3756460.1 DNA repair protein RecN [Bacteroidales bacterium]MDI9575776.1 DNA repair protein RecN [Bacteroidota bacterium]HHW59680.1 DNA repair protein RecN [Bacteroidales bacterium]